LTHVPSPRALLTFLFTLTFLESVSSTLLQRGIYFYAQEQLHFTQTQNLWLALGSGVTYVAGAFGSHFMAHRVGERRLVVLLLILLGAVHLGIGMWPNLLVLPLGFVVVGGLQGLKWPIVESFVSAGATPRVLLPRLARYNVTWAIATTLGVGLSGFLIGSRSPTSVFVAAALINLVALGLCWTLPAQPRHLPDEHPERPDVRELDKFRKLLGSARWSMLGSYALMFALAPLMPSLFRRLELSVREATLAASLIDAVRVVGFAVMGAWSGWRGRSLPLVVVIALLPLSFALIVFGDALPLMLLGEGLFGLCAAFCYTSALYYALVVQNASVDAGGAHEALIGLGFVIGPGAGLLGQVLGSSGLGANAGMLLAMLPIILVCATAAGRSLRQRSVSSGRA